MKHFLLLLALFTNAAAYSQCSEFDNLLKTGDNQLKGAKPDYQEAINAYTAAILACTERAGEAKQRLAKMVSDINKLKENAVISEKTAKEARADLEKALTDIRAKNRTTFESFVGLGANLIYTLDHADALEEMKVAMDIEVEAELKRQQLTEPLCELVYFFAEGGRRPELARKAAELLLQVNSDATYAPVLQQCLQESWNTRSQFAPLLENLPFFLKFQARYYPELVTVPLGADGIFEMGSDSSEWKRESDEHLHQVKLSTYQIAATPITFYQFALYSEAVDRVLASRTPYWGRFGDHPVVNVNWYEAAEYAHWLNVQLGLPPVYQIHKKFNSDLNNQVQNDVLKWKVDWNWQAKGYRLPTEAEWELAARAGVGAKRTVFAGSDTLNEVGWYWENSGDKPLSVNWDPILIYDNIGRTHPVKAKKDNGIGVFDMSGNVWEWCWDWYKGDYYDKCKNQGLVQNPQGPESSSGGRVFRGGNWLYELKYCRVAHRGFSHPGFRRDYIGFRLVFVP
ncbi:MAG: SUMF1/EgtB/PvdO family nonheme iron enzyme [Saprospiraceae bacterium]|nr:SUMF1/EgtB/PvdO family nonheme iron enzyme [Saprospiraceae bacterium]